MNSGSEKVIGIILGDHAGIGPEIAAKTVAVTRGYIPVLVGSRKLFEKAAGLAPAFCGRELIEIGPDSGFHKESGKVYFYNVEAGSDIGYGCVTADSGRLMYDSISQAIALERAGIVDALVMEPITKQALQAAGTPYTSEFEIFSALYGACGVRAVIKCGSIFRCTVVGHVPFREIADRLTTEGIVDTAHSLLSVMGRFMDSEKRVIAVAALNPHAGEDGLFGDEEARIIRPAVDILQKEGYSVTGPVPADTVFLKATSGKAGGIVFLYHDQGNIAMKAGFFGEAVLIYVNIPGLIVSMGHGSALDIAGKGIADPKNSIACIEILKEML